LKCQAIWPRRGDDHAACAVDRRSGGKLTDPALLRWVSGLPADLRLLLSDAELPDRGRNTGRRGLGLLPRDRIAAQKTAVELADEFAVWLRDKGTSAVQVALVTGRIRRTFDGCKFVRASDIAPGPLLAYIATQRETAGVSDRTAGCYIGACKTFTRWLTRTGALQADPLAGVDRPPIVNEQERDALDPGEQGRLLQAAESGAESFGMAGGDRAMLYRVALGTGYRLNELRSLVRASLGSDGDVATLSLPARATKNRRGATQPIGTELAECVRVYVTLKTPDAAIFPTFPPTWDAAAMFKFDLVAARAAWIEEAGTEKERTEREKSDFLRSTRHNGKVLVFHSLRHTYIANMKRAGVPLMSAMLLARHSDPKLTAKRYGALTLHDLGAEVAKIASPTLPARQEARATGTDNTRALAPDDLQRLSGGLAETRGLAGIAVDSGGRICNNPVSSRTAAKTAESSKNAVKIGTCARSSTGQSIGLRSRGLGVRIPPGASRRQPRARITRPFAPRRNAVGWNRRPPSATLVTLLSLPSWTRSR
jgi:integrase